MDAVEQKVAQWLATGATGLSSEAIAFRLGLGIRDRDDHPHDPADLDRCLRLLQAVPELRSKLPQMADVSPEWAALIAKWPEIEACHLNEVGIGWTKARSAPRTYNLMRSVLDAVD